MTPRLNSPDRLLPSTELRPPFDTAMDVLRAPSPQFLASEAGNSYWLVCRDPQSTPPRDHRRIASEHGTCIFGSVGYVLQARVAGELMPTRDGDIHAEVIDDTQGRTVRLVVSHPQLEAWPTEAVTTAINELVDRSLTTGASEIEIQTGFHHAAQIDAACAQAGLEKSSGTSWQWSRRVRPVATRQLAVDNKSAELGLSI
jgi:hypothetical protein